MSQRYRPATYRLIAYFHHVGRPLLVKRGSYDQVMAAMCSSQVIYRLIAQGCTAWEFRRDPLRYEH